MRKNFFIIVILVASFLRLWQLGSVPASPDWDEAALGWNSYSLMQTGKDEYGKFLPVVLRSFDDYKPALYAYLTIPSIAVFGLNTFAVRLPSAIFGILTVVAVYFLVASLANGNFDASSDSLAKKRFTSKEKLSALANEAGQNLLARFAFPFLVSFLLAISPWHLQFSRIAFEANMGLSFNIFCVLFFLWGLKKNWLLSLSAFFAGLSLYTYQGEKIFVPLLALSLIAIYRKELLAIGKKYLFCAVLTGLIISLPLIFYTLTDPQALTRAKGVSAFADQTVFLKTSSEKLLLDKQNNDYLGLILDNRRIQYVLAGINGYLSHFDLNWLFLKGDEARHHAPGVGLLYLIELPFVSLGVYKLIFGNFPKQAKFLIFAWFLIAPIPASITSGVPHAIRTLNFLPTFQVFSAIGFLSFLSYLRHLGKGRFFLSCKAGVASIACVFFIFNFVYYLNQYFVQQNYFQSESWQYGFKEAVDYVKINEKNYDKIIVSNVPHMDQSYMFFLYYLKYDPQKYQKEARNVSGGFRELHYFGKFEFRPIEWDKENSSVKTLYVGRPGDFPDHVKILLTVNFLDGKPAIRIVEK